jgi:putative ABC transport system permease protein
MSTAVQERPSQPAGPVGTGRARGGAPARRAVVRWAWRMFRREWRRQALILALLTVAVAATTIGLAVISNVVELRADPTFGTSNTIFGLSGSDPQLAADIAAFKARFGTIDVVSHQSIPVPGSVSAVDVRAENPAGPFVNVTVRLDAGRFPSGPNQVAVTSNVAQLFDLHVGSVWQEGGQALQVVGLVENPLNLLDEFALVAPGQIRAPASVSVLVDATNQSLRSFRLPGGGGLNIDSRGTASKTAAEALVLVLGTIGLLFVGLLAVAGFAVIAQRRLRSLGMLSSLGATDRQVRLVMLANGAAVGATSAAAGAAVGLAGWLVFAPTLQSLVEHRVDRFALPWWAIAAALVLAFVTAVLAAWWPARAVARIPIVAALSGRPPRPQPARRFAAAGGLVLAVGLVLLCFAVEHHAPYIIGGTIATVVGMLLMAPLAIQAIARLAGRSPIAVRLALRDLARYQARSGAALGAATLAVAIAATIAISAAAAQTPTSVSNLPANQLNLYVGANDVGPGNPVPVVTSAQQADLQTRVDQLAASLHAGTALPIDGAFNPLSAPVTAQPGGPGGGQPGGQVLAAMASVMRNSRGESISPVVNLYVATPELLSHYGINPSTISPTADVITSRTDLGGLQVFEPIFGPDGGPGGGPGGGPRGSPGGGPGGGPRGGPGQEPDAAVHPDIQIVKQLPAYTSDANTLLTSHGMQALGLQSIPAGWIVQTTSPLTTAQIDTAVKFAASAGLSVEQKTVQRSEASLRNWSTAAGILVALGVLAMTVGLIRSETAGDLRTLTASGATSATRRGITGATAGALALLGALIGTAGAYAALIAWHRSNLHPLTQIPIVNLVVIVAGLPLLAMAGGWLLAGREPAVIARQPLE